MYASFNFTSPIIVFISLFNLPHAIIMKTNEILATEFPNDFDGVQEVSKYISYKYSNKIFEEFFLFLDYFNHVQ